MHHRFVLFAPCAVAEHQLFSGDALMRLQNKVALITGGGRGIGRAVALGYAREGAQVALVARTQTEVEAVANEVRALGQRALALTGDVADEAQVKDVVAKTIAEFGKIDILVNNAGIANIRPVYGIPLASWERTLAVNLTGTFLFTKHVWKAMAANGGGSIINISSKGGREGYPMLAAYCASKWGQIGFTKAAAEEGKAVNIRVNAVAPGKGDTAFRAQVIEDKTKLLTAEDHVGVCIFLASEESKFMTGEVLGLEWFGKE
jgi:NAD(P)-dependent dehydrogenase (short-subunit alcohol dehydrogenase family)